jgi:tRNA(adenine34) deaminase
MGLALELACQAGEKGEIPVGAVVVLEDEIIARAYNEKELRQDATAHAELLALQRAAENTGSWRLNLATLYTTLEPRPGLNWPHTGRLVRLFRFLSQNHTQAKVHHKE